MNHCTNCQTPLQGPYCQNCGQRRRTTRWSTGELATLFVQQLTNIEKGFWYTGIALMKYPGVLIRTYWKGGTVKAYNPFRYVLVWTAINLLISFWLGIDDLLQEHLQPDQVVDRFGEERISRADQKFDAWLNALVLLLIPFFALLTKWLFRKAEKNYAEHLIMNAFIMGQQSLITSFTHFIFFFAPALFVVYIPFNFAVGLFYNAYVFNRVFSERPVISLLKALVLGLAGMIVYLALITGASAVAIMMS